jgi:hypothetical protein
MTMTKRLISLALLGAILVSCNFPLNNGKATETQMSDADQLATAVEGTVQAISLAITAQAAQATEVPPTATVAPTVPAMATNTVGAMQPTTSTTTQVCNQAEFISETIPDGTNFGFNESFTKTWTFKNTGTCTWGEDYAITFASGAEMDGSSTEIDETVSPGEEVYVSVDLIAPSSEGTYVGYWKMADSDGNTFGTSVYVQIVVSEDAITQTPTSTTEYTSTPEPTSTTAPTSTNTTAPVSTDTPVPTEASTGDSGDTTS